MGNNRHSLARKLLEQLREILINSDTSSLISLSGLLKNYIPWSSSAMKPDAVTKILNDIIVNERKNILEFGSGISTIYIAAILRQIGEGKFFSVEHDESWINILLRLLKNEGLNNYVTIIHAPLEKSNFSLNQLKWYSESRLVAALGSEVSMDCVIIDGPPAYTSELKLSRYPALPFLIEKKMLSQDSIIILDDGQREGEKRILKKWRKNYNYQFKQMDSLNVAVCYRGKFINS